MLLNKLGYELPGNAFSLVAGDLTIRKLEFGSVTAKLTLWDRTGPTKKWKWSSHFLWEPVWVLRGMANTSLSISWGFYCEGESLPGGVSSCCTLHGHKKPCQREPQGWMYSLGAGGQGWEDQSSCAGCPRGELQMSNPAGTVLFCRVDFLQQPSSMRVSSGFVSMCALNIQPWRNPPPRIYPPTPEWEQWASPFHQVPGSSLPRKTPQESLSSLGEKHLCYPHLPQDVQPSSDVPLSPSTLEREPGFIESRHLLCD